MQNTRELLPLRHLPPPPPPANDDFFVVDDDDYTVNDDAHGPLGRKADAIVSGASQGLLVSRLESLEHKVITLSSSLERAVDSAVSRAVELLQTTLAEGRSEAVATIDFRDTLQPVGHLRGGLEAIPEHSSYRQLHDFLHVAVVQRRARGVAHQHCEVEGANLTQRRHFRRNRLQHLQLYNMPGLHEINFDAIVELWKKDGRKLGTFKGSKYPGEASGTETDSKVIHRQLDRKTDTFLVSNMMVLSKTPSAKESPLRACGGLRGRP